MNISVCQRTRLTPEQEQEVLQLVKCCQKQDVISLTYPLPAEEPVLGHYLLHDARGQLLSVLALLPLDDSTLECIAFTHPRHRQKGYFSRLLAVALEDWGEQELLFPVSGSCKDTLAALKALGAELFRQELQMERDLSLPLPSPLPKEIRARLLAPKDIFAENALWRLVPPDSCQNPPGPRDRISPCQNPRDQIGFCQNPRDSRDQIGSCRTSPVAKDKLCLHEVQISPHLQGKGVGTLLVCLLLSFLSNKELQQKTPVRKLLLHVSGDNSAAVALYKKTGFRITETLSYYWY